MQKLSAELSGQKCRDHVQMISRYHRIQASPGYRAAAEACLVTLQESGLPARIQTYPATGRDWSWAHLTPQEWNCEEAELWLLGPKGAPTERLAWYDEVNLSIIQRSDSTPAGGVTAALAAVENGADPAVWTRQDLRGKIVLVGDGDIHRMLRFAQQAGAVGLVTDRMTYNPPTRPPGDLADALQYTSFWWSESEPKGWGFVVSPRTGVRLRQAVANGEVRLHARVEARFYDGSIENVEALIPGTTAEEVLLISHLCHPKPSANDNATGPATLMEAARALQRLISTGALPPPRRSIRFLHPPEMTGTYAHLAAMSARERERIVGALNVDMVGQKQEETGSVLLCEYPPLACPSFAGDLLGLILAESAKELPALSRLGARYAGFRHAEVPFSGGSDHYIMADPTVGVPCPMIIQWPDRFYHTSADTLERTDPAMMKRVALMAAAYGYFLASAGPAEVRWLAAEMTARFPAQLHAALSGAADPEATAGFRVERKLADLASLERLLSPEEQHEWQPVLTLCRHQVQVTAELELQRLALQGACTPVRRMDTAVTVTGWLGDAVRTDQVRPVRLQPGPISLRNHLGRLPEPEEESWRAFTAAHGDAAKVADYLGYWADGTRTLAEICRLTELETGLRDDAWAVGYFQLLDRLGLARGV